MIEFCIVRLEQVLVTSPHVYNVYVGPCFFMFFSTSTSHTARSIEGEGIAIAQGFLMSVSHSQCFLLCMNGPCQGPQG